MRTLLLLAALAAPVPAAAAAAAGEAEARYGIAVQGVRLSAAGTMLDFRYTVTDPAKAAALLGHNVQPVLIDAASGARLAVPAPAKVGALRSVTARPEAGRSYFTLFANPGRLVKAGREVSVEIGGFRVDGLRVEG